MNPPAASNPTADWQRLESAQRGELAPHQRDFDDQVVHALGELTPAARACLLLRTVEQMEYREISGILGIPEGTAMSHVHRSRQLLRASLGKTTRPGTTAANPDGMPRATSEDA